MNELNLETLEWLLMVAIDKKEECLDVIEKQKALFFRSIRDLEDSGTYHARMIQINNANICIAFISEQILKLKNVTI